MEEQKSKSTVGVFMNPSIETIQQKYIDLKSTLKRYMTHHNEDGKSKIN